MVTFTKESSGQFAAMRDGQLTGWLIVNGSQGLSGRDTRNMYGIVAPSGKVAWIGSLASCKRLIMQRIEV